MTASATGSVAAVILMIMSATGVGVRAAGAQQEPPAPWHETPGCIAMPVRDVPFSAEAVTTLRPAPPTTGAVETRQVTRYFRDRDGRVRVEWVGGPTPQRVVITLDADRPEAYYLDTLNRTVVEFGRGPLAMITGDRCSSYSEVGVLPLAMNRFLSLPGRLIEEEPLGERLMEGVQVTGKRGTVLLPPNGGRTGVGERWISTELKLVVSYRREDAFVGVIEHQLTKIILGDPPGHLFEVPGDYTPAEFNSLGTWTWENAYACIPGQVSHDLTGACRRR